MWICRIKSTKIDFLKMDLLYLLFNLRKCSLLLVHSLIIGFVWLRPRTFWTFILKVLSSDCYLVKQIVIRISKVKKKIIMIKILLLWLISTVNCLSNALDLNKSEQQNKKMFVFCCKCCMLTWNIRTAQRWSKRMSNWEFRIVFQLKFICFA